MDASFANDTFVYCGDTSTSAGFEARTWTGGNGAGNYVHTYPHSSGGYASWASGGGGSSGRKHMDPAINWSSSSLDDYGFTTSTASYDKWGGGGQGHHCGTGCAYKTHVKYSGKPGVIRISYQLPEYYTPTVNITTDIAANYSTTAGSGQNFVVAASDNANSSGSTITYQWKYSTNSGSTWTDIAAGEGGTSATLTRYATSYYSDNGHQIKCAMTATNPIGSNTKDSTVCTLTVNRNMTCSGSPTTGTQWNVSGDGLKPSGTNNDETWGNWNPNWSDVCEVGAGMNMRAAGRCGFCETNGVYQGWNMKLQLQIVGGGTVRYYNEQTKSSGQCGNGSHGDFSNFSISSQSWDPSWGSPEFRVQIIADGTNCGGSAGENIFAEQYNNTGKVDWSYKTATYNYDTRP